MEQDEVDEFSKLYDQFIGESDQELTTNLIRTNIHFQHSTTNYNVNFQSPFSGVKSIRLVDFNTTTIIRGGITSMYTMDIAMGTTFITRVNIIDGDSLSNDQIKAQIEAELPPELQLTYDYKSGTMNINGWNTGIAKWSRPLSSVSFSAFVFPSTTTTSSIYVSTPVGTWMMAESHHLYPNSNVFYVPVGLDTRSKTPVILGLTAGTYLSASDTNGVMAGHFAYNLGSTSIPTAPLTGGITTSQGVDVKDGIYNIQIGSTIYAGMVGYLQSASIGITTYNLVENSVCTRNTRETWVFGTDLIGSTKYLLGISRGGVFSTPFTWTTTINLPGAITTFDRVFVSPNNNQIAVANFNSITQSGLMQLGSAIITKFTNMGKVMDVYISTSGYVLATGTTNSMLYNNIGAVISMPITSSNFGNSSSPTGEFIVVNQSVPINSAQVYRRFHTSYVPYFGISNITILDTTWVGTTTNPTMFYTASSGRIGQLNFNEEDSTFNSIQYNIPVNLTITVSPTLSARFGGWSASSNTTSWTVQSNPIRYCIGDSDKGTIVCFTNPIISTTTIQSMSIAGISSMDGDPNNLFVGTLNSRTTWDIRTGITGNAITSVIFHSRQIAAALFISSIGTSQLNINVLPPHFIQIGDNIQMGNISASIMGTTILTNYPVITSVSNYIGIQTPSLSTTTFISAANDDVQLQWVYPTNNILFIPSVKPTNLPNLFNGITEIWMNGMNVSGSGTATLIHSQPLSSITYQTITPNTQQPILMTLNYAEDKFPIIGSNIHNVFAMINPDGTWLNNPLVFNGNLPIINSVKIGFTSTAAIQSYSTPVHNFTLEIVQAKTKLKLANLNTNENHMYDYTGLNYNISA